MKPIEETRIHKVTTLAIDIPHDALMKALEIDPKKFSIRGVSHSFSPNRNQGFSGITLTIQEVDAREARE